MEAVRPKKKQNRKDKQSKNGGNSKWKNDQRNIPSDIIRVSNITLIFLKYF